MILVFFFSIVTSLVLPCACFASWVVLSHALRIFPFFLLKKISYAVIVCVSRQYKQSSNCRMEAKYANDRFKRGRLKLLYVMMDAQYTTRSEPECVDGWLGIMLGDALWYPLWNEASVASTAKTLASVLGTNALSAQSAMLPPQQSRSASFSSYVDPPALLRAPTAPQNSSAEVEPASTSAALPFATVRGANLAAKPATFAAHAVHESDSGGSSGSAGGARSNVPSPRAEQTQASARTATQTRAVYAVLPASTVAAGGSTPDPASVPCDELERAFRLLQSASKVRDAAAVAALCDRLGLSEASELAWLSEPDEAALAELLKPLPALLFQQALHAHRVCVRALGATRAWSLLNASAHHTDTHAVTQWLLEFGVSGDDMLAHMDQTQVPV
jgi:hypothetical protein